MNEKLRKYAHESEVLQNKLNQQQFGYENIYLQYILVYNPIYMCQEGAISLCTTNATGRADV